MEGALEEAEARVIELQEELVANQQELGNALEEIDMLTEAKADMEFNLEAKRRLEVEIL